MPKVQTISPMDGQLIREYTTESTQALSAKIAAMQTAFSLWHIKPVEARAAYLENLVDLLQTQQVNLATLITTEMGSFGAILTESINAFTCVNIIWISALKFYVMNTSTNIM